MTMLIAEHIKILQTIICYLFPLLNRGSAILNTVLLRGNHTMYRMSDAEV